MHEQHRCSTTSLVYASCLYRGRHATVYNQLCAFALHLKQFAVRTVRTLVLRNPMLGDSLCIYLHTRWAIGQADIEGEVTVITYCFVRSVLVVV